MSARRSDTGDGAEQRNALGAFLLSRRERLSPSDYDLPPSGRRQVRGLRREEVALLAGMSSHYYTRLEQGRDRHPSRQVLDALARVLRLDDETRAHLDQLAQPPAHTRRAGRLPTEHVRPQIEHLLAQWTDQPALVIGRHRDVLAANPLARALNPGFHPGRNLVRDVFTDAVTQSIYLDRDDVARDGVAALRASVGADVDDPVLTELVDELSANSDEFRRMWARHDVQQKSGGSKRFNNPLVGPITLSFEVFSVSRADGQLLYVFFAESGTEDARSLALLSELADRPDVPRALADHELVTSPALE